MESQQTNIINKIIGGIISIGVIAGVATLAMKDKKVDTVLPTTEVAGTEESEEDALADGSMLKENSPDSQIQAVKNTETYSRRNDDDDDEENEDDEDEHNTSPRPAQATVSTGIQAVVQTNNSYYKDGTYNALGSYKSPAGTEQVSVSIVLKNNIVYRFYI